MVRCLGSECLETCTLKQVKGGWIVIPESSPKGIESLTYTLGIDTNDHAVQSHTVHGQGQACFYRLVLGFHIAITASAGTFVLAADVCQHVLHVRKHGAFWGRECCVHRFADRPKDGRLGAAGPCPIAAQLSHVDVPPVELIEPLYHPLAKIPVLLEHLAQLLAARMVPPIDTQATPQITDRSHNRFVAQVRRKSLQCRKHPALADSSPATACARECP
eukprot:scaffold20364_cov112-Isochrysis_galbana.AAC.5